jgi:O-methyltransferase
LLTPKLFEDYQYSKFDYDYCFRANQLVYLCQCLDQVMNVEGNIAEIGVYQGRTTVFLNKYLDSKRTTKKYYAIDTFSGFTSPDIDYEVSHRQKTPLPYSTLKSSKSSFDKVMARNSIDRVIVIQADVNSYDLKSMGSLCFALLDVDLYLPVKKSLKELYSSLSPGGIIIVDDCAEADAYDGSNQAYREFIQENNQTIEIVHDKLGVIRKPQ